MKWHLFYFPESNSSETYRAKKKTKPKNPPKYFNVAARDHCIS